MEHDPVPTRRARRRVGDLATVERFLIMEQRPNPDELLARVQAEEVQRARGKLKVFFGATAGVGKTYAMLEAALDKRAEGIDVLIGYVETHGRVETERLL